MPCPVCGSINHPNLAKIRSEVLTKEELDAIYLTTTNQIEVINKIKMVIIFLCKKFQQEQ